MKIEINNTKLKLIEEGKGVSILFVHGSNSDYRTWETQLKELSKHFHCITYSRRYHYPNEKIPEGKDYSMLEQLEDLEAVVETLNVNPVHIIGHSYGGLLTLLLAIRNPELIKSMILIEPPIFTLFLDIPPKPLQIIKLLIMRPRTAIPMMKFVNSGVNPAEKYAREGNMERAFQVFTNALLGKEFYDSLTEERIKIGHDNLIKMELLGSGFLPLNEEDVRKITKRTLLIKGEKSPNFLHKFIKRLHELLPNSIIVSVPNASHIVHEDNPTFFNEKILSFIKNNNIL